jgi:hypothetical protein
VGFSNGILVITDGGWTSGTPVGIVAISFVGIVDGGVVPPGTLVFCTGIGLVVPLQAVRLKQKTMENIQIRYSDGRFMLFLLTHSLRPTTDLIEAYHTTAYAVLLS